jgi:hypothetical protein
MSKADISTTPIRSAGVMTEHTLITPRRNFLIRALGFTLAGATVPISIITADDAKARITHHQGELERAWRDYYGPSAGVRTMDRKTAPGELSEHQGELSDAISAYAIFAGGRAASPRKMAHNEEQITGAR